MQFKRRFVLFAATLAVAFAVANSLPNAFADNAAANAAKEEQSGFAWTDDWNGALKEAEKANKLVLVDVYTDWCGWCKRLDKDTYSDPEVSRYMGEKFVCIKANAEKPKMRAKIAHFKVEGFPAILVLDSSGKLKGRMDGYLPPKEFNAALHQIVEK